MPQIYIQHLHPSMKSINYGPLTGRKMTTAVEEQVKERKEEEKDGYSLLEMRRIGWSLIICKEMKQTVFLMWG